MPVKSAGLLLFRYNGKILEVLLVHPGGPYWAKKDEGAWSIPKGEFEEGENPLNAAKRETQEELGIQIQGHFLSLTPLKQKSGKLVYAWAVEADLDPGKVKSNKFEIEWPPKSGRKAAFPEVDRAEWLNLEEAKKKIIPGQLRFIEELERIQIPSG